MSVFANFQITDDDSSDDAIGDIPDPQSYKIVECPFTILCDSREQQPYQFSNIVGDFRDEYARIQVKTTRRKLDVADYAIQGIPGIAIERKSKADLFGSVATGAKRENFVERLRKMQSSLRFGAVVVECESISLYDDPPANTSLNPKTVYRTALSWAIQFPMVHWVWCRDREWAEQTTFRLLEKYFEHETSTKYKHHNKPIDINIEAYELGIVSRMMANEIEAPYGLTNALRVSWQRGWNFYSTRFAGGDLGVIYEQGQVPPSEMAAALSAYKGKKKPPTRKKKVQSEEPRKPLPGQKAFPEFEESPEGSAKMIDNPRRK